jgi:type VI protein secretion system component VasA
MENKPKTPGPEPLRQLFKSYAGCLQLDRGYLAETRDEDGLDLDRLELFLCARSELVAEAEQSLKAVEALEAVGLTEGDPDRQALLRQVVAVLEEMTGLEKHLSVFLGERLREIGEAISQLRRIQPVFQRYSHLGGDKADPSFITRHE